MHCPGRCQPPAAGGWLAVPRAAIVEFFGDQCRGGHRETGRSDYGRINRLGPRVWTLAPGSQGMVDLKGLEETANIFGNLSVTGLGAA